MDRPVATGAFGNSSPLHIFVPPKLCPTQKNLFQTYNNNKNLDPLKMHFAPQTLKLGYGPSNE